MKYFSMMAAAVAMTAMTMVSCDGKGGANLKDGVDTLAYNLGVAQTEGLKQYMTMQLGVDTTYMTEFIKGMKEGAVNEVDPKKTAYMKGLEVGGQVQQMAKGLTQQVYAGDSTKSVNVKALLAGLVAGLQNEAAMTADEAYEAFNSQLEPIRIANLEKQYGDNKLAGEKYLEENKAKEGVTVTESGLQYKVLVAGDGCPRRMLLYGVANPFRPMS